MPSRLGEAVARARRWAHL